ncbi:MAG: hypothetical protein AAGG68_26810 [Bacteroidota bacterium]
MKVLLHSDIREIPLNIKIGQSGNHGRIGYLEIEHEICAKNFILPIANYPKDQRMIKWIRLIFPNKYNYSYSDVELLAELFELKEHKSSTNGRISFKATTPHEYEVTVMAALFKCEENERIIAAGITLYGDYGRYPGLCVHLVGIEEVPEHIQKNLSFLKEDI